MSIIRLIFGLAIIALLAPVASADNDHGRKSRNYSPLVKKIREATYQFRHVDYAIAAGYEGGPCVSGRDGGAMGIHFVNGQYLGDDAIDATRPEVLIYEPQSHGGLKLVGVEFITFAGPADLNGHLLNYSGSPNRYGLPPHYELHVWAWRHNPDGTFADWNPDVKCDAFIVE